MQSSNDIKGLIIWRAIQAALLVVGIALVATLIWLPDLGIDLFWNLLIPVAPAVVVLIPGVWRNICPLGTTSLLPRHLGLSQKKLMSQSLRSTLVVTGFIALLLIVPLRHLILNTSGPATAVMLIAAAVIAIVLGLRYEWRSAWCSSLCPIHPVEKLYGTIPAVTVPNTHCTACEKCVTPCPDSTQKFNPTITNADKAEKNVGMLLVGGFVGYVYGWYQVPDYFGAVSMGDWITAFAWPLGGFVVSYSIFSVLFKLSSKQQQAWLIRVFAVAAVSAYYWYRLPMLFGFSDLPNNSALIDLTGSLPDWFPLASQITTSAFFIWFMLLRNRQASWSVRPAYSNVAAVRVGG